MKIKIIIFLFLFIFFAPAASRAMVAFPPSLTIIVNTQGSDASFNFDLTSCYNYICNDPTQISLQTQDLSASQTMYIGWGGRYYVQEENIPGLKINSIFCTSDNPNDVFWYQPDTVSFSPITRENITCTFNNVKVQEKIPVLIVPGLVGTEMKDGSELLWPDVIRMINPLNSDNFMDPLQFQQNLIPSDENVITGGLVGEPFPGEHYYDLLVNEFKNQGYVENESLFTFPYDWRYGVSGKFTDRTTNADLLAAKIQDIIAQTGSDKVDVIAHSMGGLLVKKYTIDHPTNNYIGKAVFVGVPNTGAPKAVKVLLQGDNFNVLGLNDLEMKKISANMPAAYDLLPSQQYYDTAGSFVSLVDFTQEEPVEKDLNYQEFGDYLISNNFNQLGFNNAETLHSQAFDDYDIRNNGVDLYAIDGCKTATMTNFVEVKSQDIFGNYRTDYARVELKTGDGTVPIQSSTNLPIDQSNKYYALVSNHGKMLSEDGIRQEIVNLISGSSLAVNPNLITQDGNQCQLNGKAIIVFSPVNIFVTDQNGNRLGLADDGSVINEIPNADFEIMGERKFLYLPQDSGQVYNINLNGTGTGTFTLKSQNISNSQVTITEVFSNLPVTPALTGQVNLSGGTTTLSLNNLSEPILPSAILDASESEDLLPPVSTVTLTGNLIAPSVYLTSVAVEINAKDDNSEVLAVEYNLDNAGFQKVFGDTVEFVVSNEGQHAIIFFSTDKAGNNEQDQTINFEVKKLPTSKDQCKNNNWKDFGNTFKNQGDCVSFVETGR